MLKRTFTVITFFLIGISLVCQITNVDLLKKNLSIAENDTVKVELLNTLGNHYVGRDSVYAFHYLELASDLAKSIRYQKGEADNALYTGRFYYYLDDYNLAIDNYNKAFDLYNRIHDTSGLTDYYFSAGELYKLLGDYEKAISSYQESIQLSEKIGDERNISKCFVGLGRINLHQENYDRALEYFSRALDAKKRMKDAQGIATVLMNIGDVFIRRGMHDSALYLYNKALYLRDSIGEKRRIAISLQKVAGMHVHFKRFDTAAAMYDKAYDIFVLLKEKAGQIGNLLEQAKLARKTDNLLLAKRKGEKALMLAKETGNSNFIKECYRVLHRIYASSGDYEKAYEALQQFSQLYIQIASEKTKKTIADLEVKYQMVEKDQQINLLNGENEIQKQRMIILIISLSGVLLTVALIFVLLRYKLLNLNQKNILLKKEKEIQQSKAAIREREKTALREKLDIQNKELVSKAILMNRTAETVRMNSEKLKQVLLRCGNGNHGVKKDLSSIIRNFETFTSTNLWDDFEIAFKNVHTEFYSKLLSACPDLTRTEIKIAALLRLNLTTKEIESITFKSESGIKSIRYRLRKKLELDSDQGLTAFLMKL